MINRLLRRHSRLVEVPADLNGVTDIGQECADDQAGLAPGSAQALWRRVQALYATGVQPGMQLCVRHGGQVVLDRSIGLARGYEPARDPGDPVPLRTETPTNLFSAGKAVTALLIHKLEELGLLNIDEPVARYLPGFARHNKGRITIRQVMNHQAALHHLPFSEQAGLGLDTLADADAMREQVNALRPVGRAGGAPAYHAVSGGMILAELMRAVTQREPQDLLAEYVKQPLGLRWLDYGIKGEALDNVAWNAATGLLPKPLAWHMQRIVGGPFEQAVAMSNDPRFLQAVIPSANVISTARDVSRLYQCVLDDGQYGDTVVFKAETIRRALQPGQSRPRLDRKIGLPMLYSAGFMLGHRGLGLYGWNRRHTFGHLGLSNTLTWARRDTGTVIALLCTGKPVIGPHLKELLSLFFALNAFCENRLRA